MLPEREARGVRNTPSRVSSVRVRKSEDANVSTRPGGRKSSSEETQNAQGVYGVSRRSRARGALAAGLGRRGSDRDRESEDRGDQGLPGDGQQTRSRRRRRKRGHDLGNGIRRLPAAADRGQRVPAERDGVAPERLPGVQAGNPRTKRDRPEGLPERIRGGSRR